MDLAIRPVADEEFPAFCRVVETAFGNHASDEEVEGWRGVTELDRTLAAFEGPQVVATAAAMTLELTLPGGVTAPAAGVTAVGVRPSHRRRGLLRALMERQLDDVAGGHEAIAVLNASESIIYGRFGYGRATARVTVQIDPRRSQFSPGADDAGRIEMLEAADVAAAIPAIHDRARRGQPGDISRSTAWWDLVIADPEWSHRDAGRLFWAQHLSPTGQPDGYVSYRVHRGWAEGLPDAEITVEELVGLDGAAEVALWRFVLDLDLASRVVAIRPVDEALRWRLADPRRLRTTSLLDQLWARLLDVPVALEARRYAVEDEIVLDVRDAFRPGTDGRYLLGGGPDGAVCTSTTRDADLTLSVADLGSAYLGDPRFAILARAGRVDEHRAGALAKADRMFAGSAVPFCHTDF